MVTEKCGIKCGKNNLFNKKTPNITAKQIEEATQLSRRGVEYNLDKLKKEGKLKRIGPAKGAHWQITEK